MNLQAIAREWRHALFNQFPRIERLASRLYALVPGNLRLGKDFCTWLAFMETSEHWSLPELQGYQMTCLRRLLTSLKAHSPYYASLLAEVEINRIRELADFQNLVPSLPRSTFRDRYGQILSRDWRRMNRVKASTSGTTGQSLQFFHLTADNGREWAALCHQWRRVGYDPFHSIRAEFRGLTTSPSGVDIIPHSQMIRCSILDMNQSQIGFFGEQIRRAGVTYFHGYPSAVYLLARRIKEYGISFPQPKGILLASEMVYQWQLEDIKAVFPQARIFAHYGCAERCILAGWCETEPTYHVLPQYSLVEIDQDSSEILGTNLYNYINAFIRYRLTDTVIDPSWEPCPECHRPYVPRLKAIGGRTEDFLFSPRRGWIPPAIITFPFKGLRGIRETQIFQTKPEEITIHFIAEKNISAEVVDADRQTIAAGMQRLLGTDIHCRFVEVDEIPRSKSGKFKWVVSELTQPH